jgi:cytochrome oxidase Cu insertion factor (SCO1/SenC/PrrC family)
MFLKINCLFLWLFVIALGAVACVGAAYGADGPFARDTVMVAPPQPIKVPQFDFTNLHGGTLKSSEMKGKVIVIRFWATW